MIYRDIYYYICMQCKKTYESCINYYASDKELREEPVCIDCLYKDLNKPLDKPGDSE